jgi:hypothetical protein
MRTLVVAGVVAAGALAIAALNGSAAVAVEPQLRTACQGSAERVHSIKLGMTKARVRGLLGEPTRIQRPFLNKGEKRADHWEWWWWRRPLKCHWSVDFSKKGRVTEVLACSPGSGVCGIVASKD